MDVWMYGYMAGCLGILSFQWRDAVQRHCRYLLALVWMGVGFCSVPLYGVVCEHWEGFGLASVGVICIDLSLLANITCAVSGKKRRILKLSRDSQCNARKVDRGYKPRLMDVPGEKIGSGYQQNG